MKIIKIPYSLGALEKSEGIEKAPDAILSELKSVWLSEDFHKVDFQVENIRIEGDVKKDLDTIKMNVSNLIEKFTVFIGGDHSITYSCYKAVAEKYKNCGLVIFDAHPDCFQNFDYPVHEDWLKFLIDQNFVKANNVILIGLRNPDIKELEFLKDKKIKFFTTKNILADKEKNCDLIMELCRGFDSFYISIDIDIIDPAFAPGTGYIEPGGFSSREMLYFIQRLKLLKNLRAVDIVEINPLKDINNMTSKLGAKLIGEFM